MSSSIVEQYTEQVSAAWLIRQVKCNSPHLLLEDRAEFEARLEAHFDGLRIAGEAGWRSCEDALSRWGQPGEMFAAAVLAVEQRSEQRIDRILPSALACPENEGAFVSALGWLPWEQVEATTTRLAASSDHGAKRIGIAGFAVHRRDPGELLSGAIQNLDTLLRARALRAVGEIGRSDLLSRAKDAMQSDDAGCKCAAAWSVARLCDDAKAVETLKKIVEASRSRLPGGKTNGDDSQSGSASRKSSDQALQLVLRRMEVKAAAKWLNKLAQKPGLARQTVVGAGVVGAPEAVPWLFEMMKTPALARVAGEAFTMITGVDLVAQKMEGEWPAGFEAGPNEDPADENVEMDEDENLPWPDAVKLAAWWERHRGEFEPGVRHLCGQPLTEEWLEQVLRCGYQRQRAAAALELAIRRPDQPLFNVRAPARRQQEMLGLKSS